MDRLRRFLSSAPFAALQLLLACVFVFTGKEVTGTMVFAAVIAATLAATNDLLAALPGLLLTVSFAIRCKHTFPQFLHRWYLVIPTFAFFLLYLILYRHPLTKGPYFRGQLAASVAVTLGGAGIITRQEYFSPTAIFYTVLLGFGMLLIYLFFHGALSQPGAYRFRPIRSRPPQSQSGDGSVIDRITNAMLLMIVFLCVCLLEEYLRRRGELRGGFEILPFQWRNNAATLLMLAMPFPFCRSMRRYGWFFFGLLTYPAILLTGSRGGMIFGAAELAICILSLAAIDRRHRLPTLLTLAVCVAIVFLIRRFLYEAFSYTLQRLTDPNENAIRLQLIPRGFADFRANPLFGRGLGYMGNRDVHRSAEFTLCWYHCAPVQVLGSFGLCGAAAYLYLFVVRCRTLAKHLSPGSITMFLSYLGLELMSLVNPGIFAPFPYLFLITLFFTVMETQTPADGREQLMLASKGACK